jgi:hypothetical protein
VSVMIRLVVRIIDRRTFKDTEMVNFGFSCHEDEKERRVCNPLERTNGVVSGMEKS